MGIRSLKTKLAALITLPLLCIATGSNAQGAEHIYYMQQKLANAGYVVGKADGVAGKKTKGALRLFAQQMGFEPTPEAMYDFFGKRYYQVATPLGDEANMNAVRRALEEVLFDTSSARLKDVVVLPSGNVCGYVNAKNRFGAYVGFTRFHALSIRTPTNKDELFVFSASVTAADDRRAEYFCLLDIKF